MRYIRAALLVILTSFPFYNNAAELEISSYLGYTFSPSLASADNNSTISVADKINFSLGFAWQESTAKIAESQGQGQLLINYISRDFTGADIKSSPQSNLQSNQQNKVIHKFDTLYVHFNGVSFIQESGYSTTVSLGFGASYFDSEFNDAIYPSLSTAIGTRHELLPQLTFITEVRAYATLVKDDEPLFCQQDNCVAYFDDALWFDTNISIGLAYSF